MNDIKPHNISGKIVIHILSQLLRDKYFLDKSVIVIVIAAINPYMN